MKLTRIKCAPLSRAKNIIITKDYVIGYTGKKAVILDHALNLIHEVQGLDYVYHGSVSPDKKRLLLISNGNKFYLVDLETFEMIRITVKAPYNYNLEGQGCWSMDGRRIYILIQNGQTLRSTLRCYDADDLTQYYDLIPEKYCLTGIIAIEKYGKYLLAGYDRERNNENFLIHFDGDTFMEYPLSARKGDVIFNIDFDATNDEVLIYGFACKRYKMDGSFLGVISHAKPKQKTISFADAIRSTGIDGCGREQMDTEAFQQFLKQAENSQFPVQDDINKCGVSRKGEYVYLASSSGFYVLEPGTRQVVAEVHEEYGVQNYIEIGEKILALATGQSVKIFQLE